MYTVSREEVERLAANFGLRLVRATTMPDMLGRDDIRWDIVVFEYPDDETSACKPTLLRPTRALPERGV